MTKNATQTDPQRPLTNAQKTKYTITEAHRITGKARSTIQRRIDAGKLTCELTDDGVRLIDASELMRVFPDACDFDRAETVTIEESVPPVASTLLRHQLDAIQQQLAAEQQERAREREQFQSRVDHLQESLRLAQEAQSRVTLLLEQQTASNQRDSVPWWKRSSRK